MEARTIYKVSYTYNKKERQNYMYKEVYEQLSPKLKKFFNVMILAEATKLQGRITDNFLNHIYLVQINNNTSKASLENLLNIFMPYCISESEQLQANRDDNFWLMRQKSDNNRGSIGIMNIIGNKFAK